MVRGRVYRHATMGTPADDSRTGETPAAIAADRRECRSGTTVRGTNTDFGLGVDAGQVAIGDASGSDPNTGGTDESTAADDTIAPRTRRAHEEDMDVSLRRKGGIYEVRSVSDSVYEVDIADGSCTCLDWQRRDPDGGCKHFRRVDMAIKAGTVPRPDGRVPERAITANGDRDTLVTGASRIADTSTPLTLQSSASGPNETGCVPHWLQSKRSMTYHSPMAKTSGRSSDTSWLANSCIAIVVERWHTLGEIGK